MTELNGAVVKTIVRWVLATLCGALVLGVVGIAGAAPASAATRGFFILNQSQYVLTLTSVRETAHHGCNGGDQFSPVGTQVGPTQIYRYEKTYYFTRSCHTELTFGYTSRIGVKSSITVDISVNGYGHPHIVLHQHRDFYAVDPHGVDPGWLVLQST